MGATDPLDALDEQLEWQRELYRDLHRHPELSLAEHATADRIERELTELDLDPFRCGDTGLVAVLRNGDGPTVLARADIDALPVTEDTGVDYASQTEGVMHACGHDMHAAALLGAVRLLAGHRDAWSGTYVAVFQPSEENGAGARAMLDDGLADRVPRPDVAVAQHVMPTEAGTVGTVAGPALSAADSLRITVFGRGAHGSMPHLAVDPVVMAASIVMRLQTVVSREVEPGHFAVLTVGSSTAGSRANVIPDRAELLVNMRTYDETVREQLTAAVERVVRAECQAAGSPREPEFEYYDRYPLTTNDAEATDTVTRAFTEHFGSEAVYAAEPATASEDFSHLPEAVGAPYAYWFVGSVPSEAYRAAVSAGTVVSDIPANHSPAFAPAIDPTLEVATRAQVVAALAYLAVR